MSKKTLHLVIKYSDRLAGKYKTIDEHKAVIKEHGDVWFGKMGSGLGVRTIESIRDQIVSKTPTYLFLAQGVETIHRCRIIDISSTRQHEGAIPSYYSVTGIIRQMSLWVRISSLQKVKAEVLKDYHTASSKKRVRSTIGRSMAGVFIIADGAALIEY